MRSDVQSRNQDNLQKMSARYLWFLPLIIRPFLNVRTSLLIRYTGNQKYTVPRGNAIGARPNDFSSERSYLEHPTGDVRVDSRTVICYL